MTKQLLTLHPYQPKLNISISCMQQFVHQENVGMEDLLH